MNLSVENINKRIDQLLDLTKTNQGELDVAQEVFSGLVTIVEILYGSSSKKLASFEKAKDDASKYPYYSIDELHKRHLNLYQGFLRSIKEEIALGLITTMEKEYSGEIFGEFINMAKSAMDAGHKEVASVLGCAALEDSLKKIAKINNFNVEDKGMSEVINLLKSNQIIKGATGTVISSYVKLRNKTFHAEFEKFGTEDVKALLAFTEEFIIKNLR